MLFLFCVFHFFFSESHCLHLLSICFSLCHRCWRCHWRSIYSYILFRFENKSFSILRKLSTEKWKLNHLNVNSRAHFISNNKLANVVDGLIMLECSSRWLFYRFIFFFFCCTSTVLIRTTKSKWQRSWTWTADRCVAFGASNRISAIAMLMTLHRLFPTHLNVLLAGLGHFGLFLCFSFYYAAARDFHNCFVCVFVCVCMNERSHMKRAQFLIRSMEIASDTWCFLDVFHSIVEYVE